MRPGDRIELVSMPNDPCPVPVGTQGKVTEAVHMHDFTQYHVAWDNGRTLSLIVPPDLAIVIEEAK